MTKTNKHPYSRPLVLATGFTLALLAGCETTGTTSGGSSGPKDSALASATKEAPYVNSLGMKFVPVPGTNILMCTTETTVNQYKAAGRGYQSPDFPQGGDHPAVNVSWNDAKAWCAWMSKKEGKKYRLPTEVEWNAAVGPTTFPWGNQWPPPNNAGNYKGQEWKSSEGAAYARKKGAGNIWGFDGSTVKHNLISGFRDNAVHTAPVGSYGRNAVGLSDLGGNVQEWCEDWFHKPSTRVARGGSWQADSRMDVESHSVVSRAPILEPQGTGFRCVVER